MLFWRLILAVLYRYTFWLCTRWRTFSILQLGEHISPVCSQKPPIRSMLHTRLRKPIFALARAMSIVRNSSFPALCARTPQVCSIRERIWGLVYCPPVLWGSRGGCGSPPVLNVFTKNVPATKHA